MYLYEVIWKDKFVDKIESKHGVIPDEVEEVLFSNSHIRRAEKGKAKGEDLYAAYGQTKAEVDICWCFLFTSTIRQHYLFQREI